MGQEAWAARIRAQMEKLGLTSLFQGTSGIVSDTFIEGSGDLAEGIVAFREGAPTEKLPGGKFFLEQYGKQGYSEPPEAYGAFAFTAMNLILDTIEQVGPDRKKVRKALNAVTGDNAHDSITGKVAFDDNGQNTVAVITADAISRDFPGAEVHCVYALQVSPVLTDLDMVNPQSARKKAREKAANMLEHLLEPYDIPASQVYMPIGKVGQAVNNVAAKLKADVLVVGTTSRKGIKGFLLGNSAERVLTKARCDVLAIKP